MIRYGDRTALVVVDVQNDFTDPSGSLAVRGGEEVLGPINREIVAARGAGALAGLATDYCVVETVLDARRLGFAAEVVADAIRAVDLEPGDGDRAIERMREAGAVIA